MRYVDSSDSNQAIIFKGQAAYELRIEPPLPIFFFGFVLRGMPDQMVNL